MFGSSKSAASLTSGLLARKGQARPAMRPGYVGLTPAPAEDLGWNDMGEDVAASHSVDVAFPPPEALSVPPVLRAREALETQIAQPAIEPTPVPTLQRVPELEPAPQAQPEPALAPLAVERIAREVGVRPKAAFTLRLDKDRHLRLRLASAVSHRSAQQLVTEAVDALLLGMPEVDKLVAQLPKQRKK